eukprot:g16125.t1
MRINIALDNRQPRLDLSFHVHRFAIGKRYAQHIHQTAEQFSGLIRRQGASASGERQHHAAHYVRHSILAFKQAPNGYASTQSGRHTRPCQPQREMPITFRKAEAHRSGTVHQRQISRGKLDFSTALGNKRIPGKLQQQTATRARSRTLVQPIMHDGAAVCGHIGKIKRARVVVVDLALEGAATTTLRIEARKYFLHGVAPCAERSDFYRPTGRPSLFRTKGFFSAEVVEKSEIVQEAKAALQSRLQADNAEHVKAEVMVGDPGETIAGVAQHREADLVIIGARSRYLSETVLGTTATTVLRETESADVYACHRTDPEASVDRMLLAIDGSTTTPHVLNNTHELIESSLTRQQPEVRIACVVNDLQRDEAVLMKAQTQIVLDHTPHFLLVRLHNGI